MDKPLKKILAVVGILAIIFAASLLVLLTGIGGYGSMGIAFFSLLLSAAALAVALFIAAFKVKNTLLRIIMIIVALVIAFIAVSIFVASLVVVCDPVHPPNGGGPVICDPVHPVNG